MVWFSVIDYMRERKKPINKVLRNFILNHLCYVMCIDLEDLKPSK
jgi:hypothetical protein